MEICDSILNFSLKCKILNVKAIINFIMSKMTSHCAGIVQCTNNKRVKKRDKKVRRAVI